MKKTEPSSPKKLIFWCIWTFGVFLILYLWPSFKFGEPIWMVTGQGRPHLLSAGIVILSGCFVTFKIGTRQHLSFLTLFLVNGTLFGLVSFYLFESRNIYSRMVLPTTFLLSIFFQLFGLFIFKHRKEQWITLVSASSSFVGLVMLGIVLVNPMNFLGKSFRLMRSGISSAKTTFVDANAQDEIYLNTAFYDIRATVNHNIIPYSEVWGGGIVSLDEGILVVTGEGMFYFMKRGEGGGYANLEIKPWSIRAPINRKAFIDTAPIEAVDQMFRVTGINFQQIPNGLRLWVSHHYWKEAEQEYCLRLSSLEGTLEGFRIGEPGLEWKTVFESTPGLPILENRRKGNPFGGRAAGGRIQFLDEEYLLLSIGDHTFDGWNIDRELPQDPESSYGKILKIHMASGAAETISSGHRNPQGLIVTQDNTIWSTEHGPRGGDELNLIREGRNYGWPLVTLGTDYIGKVWPLSTKQGEHKGYEYPVFAWTPSIGISNLVQIKSPLFPIWKDNLLIASLEEESLYRVLLKDNEAILVEPIVVGERIRDIIEDRDGQIMLWTDESHIIELTPMIGEEKTGEMLLAQCKVCHIIDDSGRHSIGPNLKDILGKEIGSASNFRYSPAFDRLNGNWDEETLDDFLKSPQQFVPGTSMGMISLNSESDRKKVIEYLKSIQ